MSFFVLYRYRVSLLRDEAEHVINKNQTDQIQHVRVSNNKFTFDISTLM